MHSEIKTLLYQAEERYLNLEEIETVKYYTLSLNQRLEVYELLRTQELTIFQSIADQLLKAFPQEPYGTLERALKHWLSVLRYCSMAMLMNNFEFLQRRILDYLADVVEVHQMQMIEGTLYQLLQSNLKEFLPDQQLALVQPFLEKAENTLLSTGGLV